jgi:hypothetical protein
MKFCAIQTECPSQVHGKEICIKWTIEKFRDQISIKIATIKKKNAIWPVMEKKERIIKAGHDGTQL